MDFPAAGITHACLHIPQAGAEASIPPANYMGGVASIAANAVLERQTRNSATPLFARLDEELPREQVRDFLLGQLRDGNWRRHFPDLEAVEECAGTAQEYARTQGGEAPWLALTFRYYFSGNLSSLELEMEAEVGNGRELVTNVQGVKGPGARYTQTLDYLVSAQGLGAWITPRESAEYWTGLGVDYTAEAIRAGSAELVQMLDFELGQVPLRGRQKGAQYAHGDSFGVEVHRAGDRRWIRIRNGRVASVRIRP